MKPGKVFLAVCISIALILPLFAQNKYDKLFDAAVSGKVEDVKAIIEKEKIKINEAKNSEGASLLHIAALNGEIPLTEYLLSIGANPSARDSYGWTPLHMAAVYCYYPECIDVAKLLIKKGAGKKAVTQKQWDKFPAGLTVAGIAQTAREIYGRSLGTDGYDKMIQFLNEK